MFFLLARRLTSLAAVNSDPNNEIEYEGRNNFRVE